MPASWNHIRAWLQQIDMTARSVNVLPGTHGTVHELSAPVDIRNCTDSALRFRASGGEYRWGFVEST